MIQINLLPEEFRVIEKKPLPKIPYIKYVIIAGAVFILATLILYIDFWIATGQLGRMQKKWKKIQPQFQILNQLRGEVEGTLKQENDFMETFVTTQRSLTQLMTWGSEYLPETAWLSEIRMERTASGDHFLIKGFCLPSKDKSSIEHIELYLQRLKEKLTDANLSLTTTRQAIEAVEMTQFIANFDWGKAASS